MQAICLMLASARNLIPGVKQMMGKIEVERNAGELGQHFTGATVGIIGMGNIGFQIAKSEGFNCFVLHDVDMIMEDDRAILGLQLFKFFFSFYIFFT